MTSINRSNNISDRVNQILISKGKSVAWLAEECNFKPTTLYDFFKKNTDPKARFLHRISLVLGVSIDYLITGEDSGRSYDDLVNAMKKLEEAENELSQEINKVVGWK